MIRWEWVLAVKRVLLAVAATAVAAAVLIVRHVSPKRSIFTWHSMPLELYFLSSTFFPSCAHSYVWRLGHFFSHTPFFSHLCYFMALRSFKHHMQFQMDCLCVRLNQLSHKWRATCDLLSLSLWIYCVLRWCACAISGTQTHAYVRTTIAQRQITPKRRWKL